MRRAAALLALAAWGWAALVALLDRRHRVGLGDVEPAAGGPAVSVVVPARDEGRAIRRTVAALAAQTHADLDVVVVDDESRDDTAAEARGAATDRVRVLAGRPRPDGWVGKAWACRQGAEAARGEWLLFTDADVVFEPEAVARALALVRSRGRRGLTVLMRLDAGTAAERIVQPAAAVLIRSFVAPGPLVRSPRSPVAIAAGGFILLERALYDAVGGHEAIRNRLVDDQALAERVKAAGAPLLLAGGGGHVHVRMYHGAGEVWRGWRKNTSVGLARGSLVGAATGAAAGALVAVAPLVAAAAGPRHLGVLALALQTLARVDVAEIAPTPRRYLLTLPLGTLFLSACSLASSLDRLRGGVEWRGRHYP